MMRIQGLVKWFDARKGYGFIVGPDEQDVFIHFTQIEDEGFRLLKDGEEVEYTLIEGDKGWHAHDVKRLKEDAESVSELPLQQPAKQSKGYSNPMIGNSRSYNQSA